MPRILPRSFFGQLVVSTLVVQTLFLLAFTYYIIVSQRAASEQRARQRMAEQLNRLSKACSPALARGDMAAVDEFLELSRVSTAIDVARLTDLTGRSLAVTENGRARGLDGFEESALAKAPSQQVFRIGNGQLEAVTPVEVEGRPVALLWLEPNRSVTMNTLWTIVRICALYGGFALLANLLPIFLIVRGMTRPLRRLGDATNRLMENSNTSAGFPLAVTTRNEAGELTASFNAMVGELEEQRRGLLETLALLNSMLRNAPIGVAFFDHDLTYVRVNGFLANIHGLSVDQHEGRRSSEFYPPELAKQKELYLAQVLATGEPMRNVELSGELPHAPGVKRSWLMHFYPVRTEGETVRWVGAIVVDITDRLKAEEALRKTEKLAATGRLAASIAHEINNPLESVTNLLYLLEKHEGMDGQAVEYVATAQAELARVAEITQQTLQFYRQTSSAGSINVVEVLESLLMLYRPRMRQSQVTVVKKFRGEPIVFGFGGELRQVFANLVSNAVDAMPRGGELMLRVRNSAGRRQDGTWCQGVRVSVMDSGTGMSDETLQRVFEAFFTTKEATGTGLGLWISGEIIEKHDGTVRVRSRQGKNSGTSFMLFFPNRVEEGGGREAVGVERRVTEAVAG